MNTFRKWLTELTLVAFCAITTTESGNAASLPAVTSGTLQLWLKADVGITKDANGNVSQWDDQSPNANHAAQSDPIKQPVFVSNAVPVSGQPVLRFDGVQSPTDGDFLQGTGVVDIDAGYTSFFVYLKANPTPVREQVPLWVGATGVGSTGRGYYIRSGFGGGDDEMSFAAWANDYGSGFSIPADIYRIWTHRLSDDKSQIEFFDTDGANDFSATRATRNLLTPAAGYYVGGLGSQVRNLQGDIAEIIYYKGALNDADRVAVETYLKQKYYQPGVAPFVKSTSPSGKTVRTNAVINIEIQDNVSQVAPGTIKLFLNDQAVTPAITKLAGTNVTMVRYDPTGSLKEESNNTVRLIFGDTSNPSIVQTNDFSFGVISDFKAASIVNMDINGTRNGAGTEKIGSTFSGQGAAGGGSVFNGITADSRLGDGTSDDNLTVGATNLLNSLGDPTTVSFTIAPVGGRNDGGGLFNDYVFVGNQGQTTGSADFTVSGLGAIPSVDAYFYNGSGSPINPVKIPGATPAALIAGGSFSAANTTYFSHVPVSDGKVSGTLTGANASIAGLSVVTPLPRPYVQSVSPTGRGVNANEIITIQLFDYITKVAPATIQLFLNDQSVSPTIAPVVANVTKVTYDPPRDFASKSTNKVKIVYSDNSVPPIVQTTEFTFVVEKTSSFLGKVVGVNFRADDGTQIMDPSDTAGVIPTARWNNIPSATRTAANLVEAGGPATTVGLDITTPGSALAAYQAGNTATEPGDKKMMTGHIYLGVGGKIDAKFSGLGADFTGPGYDVYVYYRSGAGQFKQSFAVLDTAGATVAGPATVLDSQNIGFDGNYVQSHGNGSAGHYYKFSNLHLATFTLEAVPVVGYAYLSGIQIVSAPPVLWSVAADYSIASNPNGTWSYGSMPRVNGLPDVSNFAPYTAGTHGDLGTPLDFWHTGGIDPNVSHNGTSTDYSNFGITWEAGEISMGPGSGGTLTAVRWMAPAAGLYNVAASFVDNQSGGDGADVYVYRNAKTLFTDNAGTAVNAGTGYTTGLALKKGDHLDFIVGAGADLGPTGNNTALDAIITALPLPKAVGINFRADDASPTDANQIMEATDTAGVIPTARWNNIPSATRTASNLVESEGAATTVSLDITTSPGGLSAYQAGNTATEGDKKMMTGHIYLGAGNKIDVKIAGIGAAYTGPGYDVYVYYRSGAGQFKQSFALLDTAGATVAGPATVLDSTSIGFDGTYVKSDGAGSAGHYYKFSDLHLSTFTLEAVPVVGYAYLSGLQIVQATSSPLILSIARNGADLVISWTGPGILQSVSDITGQWANVPGASSPHPVTPSSARKFYRLQH